jgi:hypothetical protein
MIAQCVIARRPQADEAISSVGHINHKNQRDCFASPHSIRDARNDEPSKPLIDPLWSAVRRDDDQQDDDHAQRQRDEKLSL